MKKLYIFIYIIFFYLTAISQPLFPQKLENPEPSKSVENFSDVVRPNTKIPKFTEPPVIDGKLDDEAWKSGAVVKDFIQISPGDNISASKPTEVYLGYDETHFYAAFKCWDEKEKIRASVAQRDNVIGEDNVRVYLDTYNDQRRAYVFIFNPLGIQQDGIYTEGVGPDYNVDILHESKGIIEDWGWSVEVKIPFKSLRYLAGKGKAWGFNASRTIDRLNREIDSWIPVPRNSNNFISLFPKINGLDEIKTNRTVEVIPTVTLKETGRRTGQTKFSNPPVETDFGLTAKVNLSPNVTLDAAINPDFADTEADAPIVEANQRFPTFFAEKRPFFLEGVEIFQTPIQAVYTRRIENPDVALKLTGKIGKNSFGIFGAIDDPLFNPRDKKALVGVVRLKHDLGVDSHIGFLATSYNYPEKRNQVMGVDGLWKINQKSEFTAQILASHSRNYFYNSETNNSIYQTGNGVRFNYQYSYNGKNFGGGIGGEGTSKKFRSDVGFTRRNNAMTTYAFGYWSANPNPKNLVINRRLNFTAGFGNDFSGRKQDWIIDSNLGLGFKGNTELLLGFTIRPENIYEDEFGAKRNLNQNGAFFGKAFRKNSQKGVYAIFSKRFNKQIAISSNFNIFFNTFDFDFGGGNKFPRISPAAILLGQNAPLDPGEGKNLNFSLSGQFNPTNSFNFNLSYDKSKLERNDTKRIAYDSNIFSFRSIYQFSRFVNIKARVDFNTLTSRIFGQYTFGWTPSPGKALYIGYNENWTHKGFEFGQQQIGFLQMNRTFFIKMSYLFRKSF